MGIWKTIKATFAPGTSTPPDARRLNAVDELALSASLRTLPVGERGWITLSEAVLCSRRWMTGTRSVRWMRWEKAVSPRLQRRVTIDPLSILCPSRGGSTSSEKHLDPVCDLGKWKSYLSRLVPPTAARSPASASGIQAEGDDSRLSCHSLSSFA